MMNNIKSQFPIFQNNKNLIYLDNAATTQKPESVINSIVSFYKNYNANIHRGIYKLSEKASQAYEDARESVANFIKASPQEIVFTSGTTHGLNLIATGIKRSKLIKANPIILLSELEHHSNILNWREAFPNAEIYYIPIKKNLSLDFNNNNLPKNPDIVSIIHASNVTGTLNNIREIFSQYPNAIKIADLAQSIAHIPINVKNLNVDFAVFSGHKMYGPTGIGVIYAKNEILEKMNSLQPGGGTILKVSKKEVIYKKSPYKHEGGTPPIAQAIALKQAIDFIQAVGFEAIQKHEKKLIEYALEKLDSINGIKIFHQQKSPIGVISITIDRIHPHDIAQFLSDSNIAIRSGHHCAQIAQEKLGLKSGTARISFGVYNDFEDIDEVYKNLNKLIKIFK